MKSKDAYDAICAAIKADPRKHLVSSDYSNEHFGNFVIAYEENGAPKSVINDRLQLALCDDLDGIENCRIVLHSLQGADEATTLSTIGL